MSGADGRTCYSESVADATPTNLEYLKDYVKSLYAGGTSFCLFNSICFSEMFCKGEKGWHSGESLPPMHQCSLGWN